MKKTIQQEVDAMIAEMASLKDFDDDVFIRYFEKGGRAAGAHRFAGRGGRAYRRRKAILCGKACDGI